MPSVSKAQFGEMGRLYSQGKITRSQLEDFNKGVHPNSLPEHVAMKKVGHHGSRKKAVHKAASQNKRDDYPGGSY